MLVGLRVDPWSTRLAWSNGKSLIIVSCLLPLSLMFSLLEGVLKSYG